MIGMGDLYGGDGTIVACGFLVEESALEEKRSNSTHFHKFHHRGGNLAPSFNSRAVLLLLDVIKRKGEKSRLANFQSYKGQLGNNWT